jgi:hypothetical protein
MADRRFVGIVGPLAFELEFERHCTEDGVSWTPIGLPQPGHEPSSNVKDSDLGRMVRFKFVVSGGSPDVEPRLRCGPEAER